MKKTIFLIALFLITSRLLAQDCLHYLYMRKGKTIETTTYGYGGMVASKTVRYIADVTTANGTTTATVNDEDFVNGNSHGKKTIYYKCTGGAFMMDISAGNSQQSNAKITFPSAFYPANMKVGDHFDDFSFQMEMTFGGQTRKMDAKITERKVIAQENITTPAGTWTCLKITYKTTRTFEGVNMPPQITDNTLWFAPNFGVIQSQVGAYVITKITAISS